ncbi:hypothetical protein [Methylobacterium sp. CM6247]
MAKSIRTRPSRTSRATVKELAARGVLSSSMVGIRSIIRAATGEIEDQGFDLFHLYADRERLINFGAGFVECRAQVSYDGGRATLDATTGKRYWCSPTFPPGSTFPVNELASRLIRQPDTKAAFGMPLDGVLCGDAYLVRDIRRHWSLGRRSTEQGEVELFNELLSTPRTLINGCNGGR